MRKLLFAILALLLSFGVANATNIPMAVDAKNEPVIWVEEVYTAAAIASATVVQWDFASANVDESTYDYRCNWAKTADAAGDIWTAGVTMGACLAGNTCGIAIRGVVPVRITAVNSVTVNTLVETSATGTATDHDANAVDESTLGICVDAVWDVAPTTVGAGFALIYVNPVAYDKD